MAASCSVSSALNGRPSSAATALAACSNSASSVRVIFVFTARASKSWLNLMLDDEIAVDEGKAEWPAIYRAKVMELAEALQEPESRVEATEALRWPRGSHCPDLWGDGGRPRHRTPAQPGSEVGCGGVQPAVLAAVE